MAMPVPGRAAWPRVLISVAWACWPALLFYLLFLQLPVFSRARLGLSALLVPPLAWIAYRTIPRWQALSRKDWIALVFGSALVAVIASLALSQIPEKTYLLYPQHKLSIVPVQFADDQVLQLKWFHSSLGDVSFDSFRDASRWRRSENGLRLISSSGGSLTWVGRTGDQTSLAFSGSRGVIINVTWDGESRTIDLGETGGNAVTEHSFVAPWWRYLALGLVLGGASLYVAVMIVLNSGIRWPQAYLPAWAAWTLLTGSLLSLIMMVWNVPVPDLPLELVLAVSLLLVAPAYALTESPTLFPFLRTATSQIQHALRRHSTLLIVGCSLVLALSIFGRSIWTNWAIFDDHDIMLFVSPGRALSIVEWLRVLPQIGNGALGISTRFRPSYWFLRVLECLIWGAQPYYWHAFRILILVVALGLFWNLLAPSLGWWGGGLLCAYALTFAYWREVIGYLGPGETYALVGLPVYIWGMTRLLQRPKADSNNRGLAGIAVLGGSLVCIGSKENFVLLALPSLFLAYRGLRSKDLVAFLSATGSILFAGYVGTGVVRAVSSGVDVYSHSVSTSARIAHVVGALHSAQDLAPLLALAALTIALSAAFLFRGLSAKKRSAALWAQLWLAAFCLVYLSQLYFYNGLWPTDTRYDFPGILYIPAAVYVLFRLGISLAPQALRATRSALVVALLLLVIARGYKPITQFLQSNVAGTNEFVSGLERIASTLRTHDDYALVIESGSSADYEAVFSYERFLRAYGVTNTLFLRIHGYSLKTTTYTQEANLVADLVQVSAQGLSGYDPFSRLNQVSSRDYPGFAALSALKDFGRKCFSLSLSGPITTECQPIN